MSYEVENKFRVAGFDEVRDRLAALGVTGPWREVNQVDRYYAHPAKDFAQTDEALRIRRTGETCVVTYKGPKIDAATKTRREIELPLPPGTDVPDRWHELWTALDFAAVAEVTKRRTSTTVLWQDRTVEVALDEVDGLGTYVELELLATAEDLDAARACLASLSEALGLTDVERRSYLEMILDAD